MIIALTGVARSGKTTAANYLIEKHGFTRVRFADTIKAMLRAMGLTEDELDGDRKEVPCELLLGQTPRVAMQTLGSEWGRGCINDRLWITHWYNNAKDVLDAGGRVVVDDVRFPNEAKIVKDNRGLLIRVTREGSGVAGNHVSELQIFPSDIEIVNNGNLRDLQVNVAASMVAFDANLQAGTWR